METTTDFFKLKHNNLKPKQGLVLISEPFSDDSFFRRSVILLAEHNKEGTVGFILNKPIKYNLSNIFEEFGDFDGSVCFGGPVNNNIIYYLHTLGEIIPGSIKIKDDLYWGGSFDILQKMIFSGAVNKNQIRFFVGYSGWDEGQLNSEIKKDFWLVSDIKNKTIMNFDTEIWGKVVSKLPEKYKIWANFPQVPGFN